MRWSLHLYFGIQGLLYYQQYNVYLSYILYDYGQNNYSPIFFFFFRVSGIRFRAAMQRQRGRILHWRSKLSRYLLHLQFY
jgi:hypothetical protein